MSTVLSTLTGRYLLPVRVDRLGHDGYQIRDANDKWVVSLHDGDLAELLVAAMNETPVDVHAVITRSDA